MYLSNISRKYFGYNIVPVIKSESKFKISKLTKLYTDQLKI